MGNRFITALIYIILILVGALLSFYIVFNFMFSDSGGLFERAVTFAVTALVYCIVSLIAGLIRPRAWKIIGVLISVPALVVTILYSMRERDYLWLNLIYFTAAIAFTFLGSYLGSRIRTGRKVK